MNPAITFKCPEKWGNMKIGMVSRFCCNCNKDVHDFTAMTREEIILFLLSHRNEKICGRITRSQLNYHREEILIIIEAYLQKDKNSNLAFYLLAVGSLLFLSCSNDRRSEGVIKSDSISSIAGNNEHLIQDSLNNKKDTVEVKEIEQNSIPSQGIETVIEQVLLGDIVMQENLTMSQFEEVRSMAEVMPEFIGGIDSLKAFIKLNLKYPEWERKNRIEGTVYVSFTIDENGKVKDPAIVRSVELAKDFDSEVLRIIGMMPTWKPGKEDGENVAVQFVIPMKFVL